MGLEVEDILIRVRKTKSQFGLSRDDRIKNISDAFRLSAEKRSLVGDRVIFLIDDVVASGSTLLEAANVLKRSGAKEVYGLILARGGA